MYEHRVQDYAQKVNDLTNDLNTLLYCNEGSIVEKAGKLKEQFHQGARRKPFRIKEMASLESIKIKDCSTERGKPLY